MHGSSNPAFNGKVESGEFWLAVVMLIRYLHLRYYLEMCRCNWKIPDW